MSRPNAGSPPNDPGVGPNEGATLPRWFYAVLGSSLLLALLFPYRPIKYVMAGVFGWIFIQFYRDYPERTAFVFILGMPVLDMLPPDMIPLPGLNTETLAIGSLVLAAFLVDRNQESGKTKNAFAVSMTFYLSLLAFSAMRSAFNEVAVWEMDHWRVLGAWDLFSFLKNQASWALLLPIAFRLFRTRAHLRTVVALIAVTTTLIGLHAIWDTRDLLLRGFQIASNRATGLVGEQPNLFGGFLAMMLAAMTPVAVGKGLTPRQRAGIAAMLVSAGAALLFTLSRGSWLALCVGIVVISLFRGARLIVLLAVVAATSSLWLPQSVVDRLAETTDENSRVSSDQLLDDSGQVRVDQWKALPTMLAEAPILGHGYRQFESLWARVGPTGRPKAAHSSIIELGAEEGLLGLAAYAWLVGGMAWFAFRLWRRSPDAFERDVAVGVLAMLACLVVLDCSGTRFRNSEVMAYVWILGGAVGRRACESSSQGAIPRAGAPNRRLVQPRVAAPRARRAPDTEGPPTS